jgi:hypothetical protein
MNREEISHPILSDPIKALFQGLRKGPDMILLNAYYSY